MDSTLKPARAAIAGAGAVTAVGLGMGALKNAVRGNLTGLRPCPRFAGRGYQSTVAGWVPDEAIAELRQRDPAHAGSSAFLLADAALREATSEFLSRRPSQKPVPPSARRALVLSTTKADITVLEQALQCGMRNAECGMPEPTTPHSALHLFPARLAADLAAAHEIAGPVQCVSVACVSGLLALQQGALLVQEDKADAVFVVGVDLLSHFVLSGFTALKSLDPGGCRPFDAQRKGLSLGEGAGAVVLTRRDASSPATLVIAGWGSSNDANHLTGPSRDGSGLALAMERALARAGVSPDSVDLVHAHGTGTAYNDAMEGMALRRTFVQRVPPFCSSKGLLGHTLGAAGLLEVLVCLIAARLQVLPGTPGLQRPDASLPESVVAISRPSPPLRCLLKINAGFGGTNAALVLEWEGT
jgi:3-oxoacyl-(acyl-carrier-protein) synthase